MGGGWYVVYASVRKEKQAELSLNEAGYSAFMPFITNWARSGRRVYETRTPLFGRYLFVYVPGESGKQDFYSVRQCDGVERIIGIAGKPSDVPHGWIADLMLRQKAGDFDLTIEKPKPLKPRDQVKVKVGKWAQMTGTVLSMSPKGRVKVLLSMFGKDHKQEFNHSDLDADENPVAGKANHL